MYTMYIGMIAMFRFKTYGNKAFKTSKEAYLLLPCSGLFFYRFQTARFLAVFGVVCLSVQLQVLIVFDVQKKME